MPSHIQTTLSKLNNGCEYLKIVACFLCPCKFVMYINWAFQCKDVWNCNEETEQNSFKQF